MREPSDSAASAAEILGRAGGRWALIGGLAALRYRATPRLTVAIVDYQSVALDRATDHVLTAEDVIVHKLIAWRPRDRNDIASILDTGIELDDEYIRHWASEWDVADRWEQALERQR